MARKIAFTTAQRSLDSLLHDLRILSGDVVGPSDVTVHDVRGTALLNLRTLEKYLEQDEPFKVYPEVKTDATAE